MALLKLPKRIAGGRLGGMLAGSLVVLAAGLAAPPATAQSPESDSKFPLVVRCTNAGTDRHYYLSTIKPDGRAVYLSPDHFAATITITGTANKITAEGHGSCAEKSSQELRDAGSTFDPE